MVLVEYRYIFDLEIWRLRVYLNSTCADLFDNPCFADFWFINLRDFQERFR
jgi:hypothetical protein